MLQSPISTLANLHICTSTLIPQYFQHALTGLFCSEKPGGDFAIFVTVDEHMFRRGHETMLNTSVTAEGFLISAGVEETDV